MLAFIATSGKKRAIALRQARKESPCSAAAINIVNDINMNIMTMIMITIVHISIYV